MVTTAILFKICRSKVIVWHQNLLCNSKYELTLKVVEISFKFSDYFCRKCLWPYDQKLLWMTFHVKSYLTDRFWFIEDSKISFCSMACSFKRWTPSCPPYLRIAFSISWINSDSYGNSGNSSGNSNSPKNKSCGIRLLESIRTIPISFMYLGTYLHMYINL